MSKSTTIKVSRKGGPSVKVPFALPETEAEWQKICPRNGTADRDALARRQLVVVAQAGARQFLDDKAADKGAAKIQEFLNAFAYDPQRERGPRGPKKVSISAAELKKAKSPDAIIAAMRAQLAAAGVQVDLGD